MEGTSQDGYIIQIQIEYPHHKIAIYKPKIKDSKIRKKERKMQLPMCMNNMN